MQDTSTSGTAMSSKENSRVRVGILCREKADMQHTHKIKVLVNSLLKRGRKRNALRNKIHVQKEHMRNEKRKTCLSVAPRLNFRSGLKFGSFDTDIGTVFLITFTSQACTLLFITFA